MLFPFFHTFLCLFVFFPSILVYCLSLSLSSLLNSTLLRVWLFVCVCVCYGVCLVLLFRCLFQSPKKVSFSCFFFHHYSTFPSVPLFFLPFPLDFFFFFATTWWYLHTLSRMYVSFLVCLFGGLCCCCCLLHPKEQKHTQKAARLNREWKKWRRAAGRKSEGRPRK